MDLEQFSVDAESNFSGTKVAKLTEYCEGLGISIPSGANRKALINLLLKELGKPQVIEKAPSAAKIVGNVDSGDIKESTKGNNVPFPALSLKELINLNLSPQAKWQGKRFRLILQRQDKLDRYLPLGWSGNVIYVPFDVEVSIPMPHYHSLAQRKSVELRQKSKTDEETGRLYIENKWVEGVGYPHSPMGVDPATAHLPESPREQYHAIAQRTEQFRTIAYPGLQILARRMRVKEPKLGPQSKLEDVKEALRWELMRKIGIEPKIDEYLSEEAFG